MRRRAPAISLIEIMLCIGLLAVLMVFVFSVIVGGLQMQTRAESVEQASSVAREQIESIKARPFEIIEGSFDGKAGSPALDGFPPPPYPSVIRGAEYFLSVDVVAVDERVWYCKVAVETSDRRMTTMETYLKR